MNIYRVRGKRSGSKNFALLHSYNVEEKEEKDVTGNRETKMEEDSKYIDTKCTCTCHMATRLRILAFCDTYGEEET